MALPRSMIVRVTDAAGRGVPGIPVRFEVGGGGGWISPDDEVFTDADGLAGTTWYMGPDPGNANFLHAFSPVGTTGFRAYVSPLLPGTTYQGADGLTELRTGDLPLILSAPHGGSLAPPAIPDRLSADTTGDAHTRALVRAVDDAFAARGAARPWLVISHLARRAADMDHPLVGATRGTVEGERAWREYHGFLAAARAHIEAREGHGLLVDVHGHDRSDRVALGYLLTAEELDVVDDDLDREPLIVKSSIREITRHELVPFSRMVRGGESLGGLLEGLGVATTPSPSDPRPDPDSYEPGGHTVEAYGSRDGGLVSAVFLQTPLHLRSTTEARTGFAAALVEALDRYYAGYNDRGLVSR